MRREKRKALIACAVALVLLVVACSCSPAAGDAHVQASQASTEDDYVRIFTAEPESLDPQRAADGDTVALNVFDRLMETHVTDEGTVVEPSLAESVDVSDDGLAYSFTLREGVTFSNGSPLTSEDVGFTLERLICQTDNPNARIMAGIAGAEDLVQGKADALSGFTAEGDLSFTITLARPRPAFLAALSSTAASILDKDATVAAGANFGMDGAQTVGTGPFSIESWDSKSSIVLAANPRCWSGAPACDGAKIMFFPEAAPFRNMFRKGELDILDVSEMGMDADYFTRGDIYRKQLMRKLASDSVCIVLNESVKPLDDVRVREALQAALDKDVLLKGAAGGRGAVRDDIVVPGLSSVRFDLPEQVCDPNRARSLLAEAGLEDGFNLEITSPKSASATQRTLLELVADQWRAIGVNVRLTSVDDARFEEALSSKALACRIVELQASYDDPESVFSGLVESGADIAEHVSGASSTTAEQVAAASEIADGAQHGRAYHAIEKDLATDGGIVIPLYSHARIFVVADKVAGFSMRWNGAGGVDLRNVSLTGASG